MSQPIIIPSLVVIGSQIVVALLESQRFDNKSVKTKNRWFIFVL